MYTFSLSVRLPEGARVKDLTHEEALRILEELPFRISCCTQPVAGEAPQAGGAVPDTDGPVVLDDATKLALLDWQIKAAVNQRIALIQGNNLWALGNPAPPAPVDVGVQVGDTTSVTPAAVNTTATSAHAAGELELDPSVGTNTKVEAKAEAPSGKEVSGAGTQTQDMGEQGEEHPSTNAGGITGPATVVNGTFSRLEKASRLY